MNELLEKISILKEKILIAIESFSYYSEFKYLKEKLLDEFNSYECDFTDEMSVKKYYGWLQDFYDGRIELINREIKDNKNSSVFDNSTEEQENQIKRLKTEIEELINNIIKNYPRFGQSIKDSYNKLNEYYDREYKCILKNGKKKIKKDLSLSNEPALALYPDAYVLMTSYITKLENFDKSCSNIKVFVENDEIIKLVFDKAYKFITEPAVIEKIKEMEAKYDSSIQACFERSFVLLGPETIQEEMLKYCSKIEDYIEIEIVKNRYLNKIKNMTLNIEPEELLDIINYSESNNLFQEELIKKLYAVVEKEKYQVINYNGESKIYDSLSDKMKNKLEGLFITRLSDYSEEETTEIIDSLKKRGYMKTMDIQFKKFFDNCHFTNEIEYDVEDTTYKIFNRKGEDTWFGDANYEKERFWLLISNRRNLPISRYGDFYEGDIVVTRKDFQVLNEEDRDYAVVGYGEKIGAFNLKTGKETRMKKYLHHRLDCFITNYYDGKLEAYNIMNNKMTKTIQLENVRTFVVDCKDRNFLVRFNNKNEVGIYDSNFNYLDGIDLSQYSKESMMNVNGGIITFLSYDDNKVIYYDYINKKEIGSFKVNAEDYNIYVFPFMCSEGLYNYIDDNGLQGYKDYEGKVVIEPKYSFAFPFLGNVAKVYINNRCGLIDRIGNFKPRNELYAELHNKKEEHFKEDLPKMGFGADYCLKYLITDEKDMPPAKLIPNYDESKYEFTDERRCNYRESDSRHRGYLLTKDHYKVDINKPIEEIDFSTPQKPKEINKTRKQG